MTALQSYRAYKDSGVEWLGEVPEHWEVRRLGTTTQRIVAGTWGSDPTGRDDIVCVRVADFDRKRLGVDLRKPTLRSVPVGERQRRLLEAGDLLLEKSGGGDLQPVGTVVHFDHDEEAVASNFIGRMRVRRQNSARYVLYLHSVLYAIRITVRSIKQTTGIQNLDVGAYLSESIPIPPLPEQAAIARFLDDADRRVRRYIRAKERLIELLEEERRATIHEAVTGRIDVRTGQPYPAYKDSGVEWLGTVPEHWEVRKLRTLFRRHGSGTTPPEKRHFGGSVSWVMSGDLNDGKLDSTMRTVTRRAVTELPALKMYPPESLVVAMYGATIGRTGLLLSHACTNQACCVLADPLPGAAVPFVQAVLISARKEFVRSGVGGGQPNINAEIVRAFRVPSPPPREQAAIVRYLAAIERRVSARRANVARQIALLREYRTRLIADVVTGQLDVRNAAGPTPEALLPPSDVVEADTPSCPGESPHE